MCLPFCRRQAHTIRSNGMQLWIRPHETLQTSPNFLQPCLQHIDYFYGSPVGNWWIRYVAIKMYNLCNVLQLLPFPTMVIKVSCVTAVATHIQQTLLHTLTTLATFPSVFDTNKIFCNFFSRLNARTRSVNFLFAVTEFLLRRWSYVRSITSLLQLLEN